MVLKNDLKQKIIEEFINILNLNLYIQNMNKANIIAMKKFCLDITKELIENIKTPMNKEILTSDALHDIISFIFKATEDIQSKKDEIESRLILLDALKNYILNFDIIKNFRIVTITTKNSIVNQGLIQDKETKDCAKLLFFGFDYLAIKSKLKEIKGYCDLIDGLESQFMIVLSLSGLSDLFELDQSEETSSNIEIILKTIHEKLKSKSILKFDDEYSIINFIFKPSKMGQAFNDINNHIINLNHKTGRQVEIELKPILLKKFMQYIGCCILKKDKLMNEMEMNEFFRKYDFDYDGIKNELKGDVALNLDYKNIEILNESLFLNTYILSSVNEGYNCGLIPGTNRRFLRSYPIL